MEQIERILDACVWVEWLIVFFILGVFVAVRILHREGEILGE